MCSTLLFNALPDIFAVMNCSVLGLRAVFFAGLPTWSADNYVNYSDTLQTAYVQLQLPPDATAQY